MVCGLKYRQVKVRASVRAWERERVVTGSVQTRASTTLLPRAWVWMWIMGMGMGIGLNMDRMDLDMEMDGLNPNQAVSAGQGRAGPVTGG